MALNKALLTEDLKKLQEKMIKKEENDFHAWAEHMATAIEKFVKSAQVAPGIPVATVGSAAAQTGQTTAPGTLF